MRRVIFLALLLTACRSAQQPAPRALTTDERQQFMQCIQVCADRFTATAAPDATLPAIDALAPPADSGRPETFVALDWAAFPVDPGPGYSVSGRAIYVAPGGSDSNTGSITTPLATIGQAVTVAQGGDKIVVRAGTYRERVSIGKDDLVVTAAPGEAVWLEATNRGRGVDISGDNVVLNGINIRGYSPAIHIGQANHTQRSVVISNLTAEAPSGNDFYDGIADYHATSAPSMEGLLIKNVVLNRFSLSVTCGNGFCKSWKLENVRVTGAGTMDGWGADGVAFENADNILLDGVEVSNVSSDGIDTKATRVVVHNCYVHNVGNNGIKMWKGGDIINTRVIYSGEAPIVFAEGPKARVTRSLIAGQPPGRGWSVVFAYGLTAPIEIEFTRNILAFTIGGLYATSDAPTLTVSDNVFWATQSGRIIDAGGRRIMLTDGDAAIRAAGWGGGNRVVDPMLDEHYQVTAQTQSGVGPERIVAVRR